MSTAIQKQSLPDMGSANLAMEYEAVRQQTVALCSQLTAEDMMVQSLPEGSPTKWHLAHTTWFFETFVLREFSGSYHPVHPEFRALFNSYYNSVGVPPAKNLRANFSRPLLTEVFSYREQVDSAIVNLLAKNRNTALAERIILGMHHEQQHQELLLTDIKHALLTNPLRVVYGAGSKAKFAASRSLDWLAHPGGLIEIGYAGDGFCYDNEQSRHSEFLLPFQLADRLVTCREYLEFMQEGGYQRPELWLSAGWDAVCKHGWQAPLYWEMKASGEWAVATLGGIFSLAEPETLAAPVTHISYFEAEAYARWAGKRLPTEAEWEAVAASQPVQGNLLETGNLHPIASAHGNFQFFGDVWEWTNSAYLPYPGYRPAPGAIGEYNGKFMSGQMVLRGGSCATSSSHIRATYRNFFPPETRWQFSGIRLADFI